MVELNERPRVAAPPTGRDERALPAVSGVDFPPNSHRQVSAVWSRTGWRWTSCLRCAGWSLHEDWYEEEPN